MTILEPEFQKLMRREQLRSWLNSVAQGLMKAGAGGMGTGSGLLMGVGQGSAASGGGPMEMLKTQEMLAGIQDRQEARGRERKQEFAQEALAAGPRYDQAKGILFNQPVDPNRAPATLRRPGELEGPPPPLDDRQRRELLAQADPVAFRKGLMESEFGSKKYGAPIPLTDEDGTTRMVRFPEGGGEPIEVAGYSVPDEDSKRFGDEMLFDEDVGKYYQVGSDGKRHYQSPPSGGVQITGYDEEGRPIISVGGPAQAPGGGDQTLQPGTVRDIEKDLRAASEGLARLNTIQSEFQGKFLEYRTRWGNMWNAFTEKAGYELAPEEKQELAEITTFNRDAVDNLNRYIKEITGAQMSEPEAARIVKGLPNPGTGIFDGDSATQFEAKMKGTIKALRRSAARYTYALRNRMDPMSIPLASIDSIMEERLKEMEFEVRAANPQIDENALKDTLRQGLITEFGLSL